MAKARIIHNTSCLCCKVVDKSMILVGPMPFCNTCFSSEFVKTGLYNEDTCEVENSSKVYKKWLKEYKEL